MGRTRRIVLQSSLVALLAAGAVGGPAALVAPAAADEATAEIVGYGWASDPGAAPSQTDPLTDPLEGTGTQGADTVPPGAAPVGLRGGAPSHVSFLKFDLSGVPADAEITAATMTLTEIQATPNITSILSCPLTEPFEDGEGQAFAARPAFSEFGCNGVEPLGDGTWTVNMAFTVKQWVSGGTVNHGVELQPGGPDNLPTGQPDPTTLNWLANFAGPESETPPVLTVTYTLPVAEPAPIVPPARSEQPPAPPAQQSTQSDSTGFAFSTPPLSASPPVAPQAPDVGEPQPEVAAPESAPEVAPAPVAAEVVEPHTPWTVYLLVPILLAIAYALSRAFTEDVAPQVSREGATSRLLKQRVLARQQAGDVTFVGA